MQRAKIIAFVLSLSLIPSFCMAEAPEVSGLFAKAAEDAAGNTVREINDWIASDPRLEVPLKAAVWAVEGDRSDIVRTRLMERLGPSGPVEVVASIRTKEFDDYKKYVADKLKWEELFDPDTPVEMQRLSEARYMIDAKVESYRENGSNAEMVLTTTITDYEKGGTEKMVAHGLASSLRTLDWAWRSGVVVLFAVCCVVFAVGANWVSIRFWHFWVLLLLFEAGLFWFLVGKHL